MTIQNVSIIIYTVICESLSFFAVHITCLKSECKANFELFSVACESHSERPKHRCSDSRPLQSFQKVSTSHTHTVSSFDGGYVWLDKNIREQGLGVLYFAIQSI